MLFVTIGVLVGMSTIGAAIVTEDVETDDGDEIVIDVEFAGNETADVDVSVLDDNDSEVNATTLSYDPADHDDNETTETTEFAVDTGNYTVDLTSANEAIVENTHVSVESTSGPIVGGDDAPDRYTTVIAVVAILAVGYFAQREGWI
ncbi:hypothetical protein D8S78_13320 [Natrialba swarupiae]|nr:hypothetical protein [Natrialba swarupiae]